MWFGQYPGPSALEVFQLQNLQWLVTPPTTGDMAGCVLVYGTEVSGVVDEVGLPSGAYRSFCVLSLALREFREVGVSSSLEILFRRRV